MRAVMSWIVPLAIVLGGIYWLRPDLFGVGTAPARATANEDAAQTPPTPSPPDASVIYAHGIVEGVERAIGLRFEMAGRLRALKVKEGDKVAAGQVLAELDAEWAQLKVEEADSMVRIAKAERELTIAGTPNTTRAPSRGEPTSSDPDLPRDLPPLQAPASADAPTPRSRVTAQKVETGELRNRRTRAQELAIAEARVALAETNLRQAQVMLERTRLAAPSDGQIVRIMPLVGEIVGGPQDPRDLIQLANRSRTHIRAEVEELDAQHVAVGQTARIELVGEPDHTLAGTVIRCGAEVHPKTSYRLQPGERIDIRVREVIVELTDDGSHLLTGLPVEVSIERDMAFAREVPTERPAIRRIERPADAK